MIFQQWRNFPQLKYNHCFCAFVIIQGMTSMESVRGTSVMNEIRWYLYLEEATLWFEKYKIYKTVEKP